MRMTNETRAKIEANHALASALQMLIGFEDRPACFGPVPSLEDQISQMATSYNVERAALVAEYVRVVGITHESLGAQIDAAIADCNALVRVARIFDIERPGDENYSNDGSKAFPAEGYYPGQE